MGASAMILAQWNGVWAIASRLRGNSTGCALRAPNCVGPQLADEGFEPISTSTFWHKYFPSTSGIAFYPSVFYHGLKIWPQAWDRESEDPILQCLAMPANFDELNSDYFRTMAKRINARYPGDVLIADGWERKGRAEYVKALHVNEIEMIEGPPPEGEF